MELKDTGAKKLQAKAQAGRAHAKDKESTHEPPSGTDSSDSDNSDSGVHQQPRTCFVPASCTSPSGNITECARVDRTTYLGVPSSQAVEHRTINPMPTRKAGNEKKRKCSDFASPPHVQTWKQGDHAEPPPALCWPNQSLPASGRHPEHPNNIAVPLAAMRATTPMYPPPGFAGPLLGHQHRYGPHTGFVGQPYGPPNYAPPYGPQGLAHPPQQNQHQQWPPGQPQFNPEEYNVMVQMRQGAYQG